MQVSRIAQTHLVYQFIIIALLFLCIGYYEFLLDKKFIFILALGPIFFYQLATLSCYIELLPIARCLNLSEILFGTSASRIKNKISEPPETEPKVSKEYPAGNFTQTDAKNTIAESIRSPNNENHATKPRTYKFRDWQTKCFTTANKAQASPSTFTASSVSSVKKYQKFTLSSAEKRLQDSELTKVYFFPYRQKRPEEWIDSKGNGRPYKIRGRVPNIEENIELDNQSTSNTQLIKTPLENVEIPTVRESELRKSYSFPFRQKRIQQWGETAETSEASAMPFWQSVDGSEEQKSRRRRSVSISSLSNQLNHIDNHDHRGFSQSLETSDTSHTEYPNFKRNSFKSSNANFNKIKIGILNCFSKMKKDNSKTNLVKKETDCKTRLLKAYFQSRENLQPQELDDDSISFKSTGEINKHSNVYPYYAPFVKRSFLTL